MRTIAASAAEGAKVSSSFTPPPPPTAVSQRTPWHSPVPYLFGGLAAMLGLIAFALLILACSYWKLSVQTDDGERQGRDLESGNGENDEKNSDKEPKVYEEKILVIMAGDQKPTFLATPVSAKVSSLTDCNASCKLENSEKETAETCRKVKEMGNHEHHEEEEEEEEAP